MSAVAPPALGGAVYDRGYRPYEGARGGRSAGRWALWRLTLRRALGLRRSWRQKVLPWTLLGLVTIPAAVDLGVRYATRNTPLSEIGYEFLTFRDYVGVSTTLLLFVAVSAPDVICPDRHDRVLPLIFSRPLTGDDYVLAKVGGIFTLVFGFSFFPQVLLYIGQMLVNEDGSLTYVGDHLDVLWQVPVSVGILALYYSVVSVAVASLTDRRIVGGLAFLGVLLHPGDHRRRHRRGDQRGRGHDLRGLQPAEPAADAAGRRVRGPDRRRPGRRALGRGRGGLGRPAPLRRHRRDRACSSCTAATGRRGCERRRRAAGDRPEPDPAFVADPTVVVAGVSVWFGPKVAVTELSCSFGPGRDRAAGPERRGQDHADAGHLRPAADRTGARSAVLGRDPRHDRSVQRDISLVPEDDAVPGRPDRPPARPLRGLAALGAGPARARGLPRHGRAARRGRPPGGGVQQGHAPAGQDRRLPGHRAQGDGPRRAAERRRPGAAGRPDRALPDPRGPGPHRHHQLPRPERGRAPGLPAAGDHPGPPRRRRRSPRHPRRPGRPAPLRAGAHDRAPPPGRRPPGQRGGPGRVRGRRQAGHLLQPRR